MKRYKLILFFNIFILLTASAQKIENLVELKQQSENRLFHRLDKALCIRRLLGMGQLNSKGR